MKNKLEFLSYNGEFPTLCLGVIRFKVDGRKYEIKNLFISGGTIETTITGEEILENGDWIVLEDRLPEELRSIHKDIERLINDNVKKGCCGGCKFNF